MRSAPDRPGILTGEVPDPDPRSRPLDTTAPSAPLAATTLGGPPAWVVAALVLAFVVLVIVDQVRRRRQHALEASGDAPLPDAAVYARLPTDHVLAKADGGLLNADDRRLVATATVLDDRDHPQAVAYLLHALRRSPEHRTALVARLAAHGADELRRHRDLVRALPRSSAGALRAAVDRDRRGARASRAGVDDDPRT